MIILNKLTKNNTCESVTVIHGEKGLILISFGGFYYEGDEKIESPKQLLVVNHRAGETYFCDIMGVVDAGIQYTFQAYNNRIKVTRQGSKPYRGRD